MRGSIPSSPPWGPGSASRSPRCTSSSLPMTATARSPYGVGHFERTSTYVIDTLDAPPDLFIDAGTTDWKHLTWRDVRRPHRVERWAEEKREWEATNGRTIPVQVGWEHFNRNFHQLFISDP